MSFHLSHQDDAVPSNLLQHMCGKLRKLKLEDIAAIRIVRTRLVGKLAHVYFSFGVFYVNWLVETLRKDIQSWGYSTDSLFINLRNTRELFIYIIFVTYSCHFIFKIDNSI